MKLFRRILAGLAIVAIPLIIGFPVALFPIGSTPATLTPREVLMAQLEAALEVSRPASSAIGLAPALVIVGLLLAIVTWLVFRPRARPAVPRAPREARAAAAIELIRGGQAPEEVVVRAHLSREAIELLRHTTMGHPAL